MGDRDTNAQRICFPALRQAAWEEFELPAAPGPHELAVDTVCSLISAGTELAIYTGSHMGFALPNPPFPLIPHYPGYALVGRVTAVGSAVEGVAAGQRVLAETGHATTAVVDTRRQPVFVLPESLSDAEGALLRMASIAMTALHRAPIGLGESVAVWGLGLVGQLAAQLYRLAGGRPVIGVDRVSARLELAAQAAIEIVDASVADAVQALLDRTGGRGADVTIEATGNPTVVEPALTATAEGGRAVLLGSARGRAELDLYSTIHRKGLALIGAHERTQSIAATASPRLSRSRNLAVLAGLLAGGELRTAGLITDIIAPMDAPAMYASLATAPERHLGVLIDYRR